MRNTITTFIALVLFAPTLLYANVEEDVWSYEFHLEYNKGALVVSPSAKSPYRPIPVEFAPSIDPSSSSFYGVVVGYKGQELAKFGFSAPDLTDQVTGRSPLEVRAPYFANADHVSFYTSGGKKVLDVSVRGSSFCNDNKTCDSKIGENYRNCPLDCPAPAAAPVLPLPLPIQEYDQSSSSTATGGDSREASPMSDVSEPVVVPPATQTDELSASDAPRMSTMTIVSIVGGILLIVLAFVVLRIKKRGSTPQG